MPTPTTSRRRRAGLVALSAAAGLLLAGCGGSPQHPAALATHACEVAGHAARCGTLAVPEDRTTGHGRTIPVRVVVVPATSPERAADPVVYLAGGPGDSAVDLIPQELPDLADLNEHRDLVFVEQRGTGPSALTCPTFPDSADDPALPAAVTSCLDHLPGDLRFYTSAMYADDVDQVLHELHYATANLMGISYGTAVAQVFLLRHPASVRTLILQSGSPLGLPVIARAPGSSQHALEDVFARCASDTACAHAFPDLPGDWQTLWAALGRSPWVLPAAASPSGEQVQLDQPTLAHAVYQALFAYQQRLVPVAVHTLATAADKTAAMLAVIAAGNGSPTGNPANLALPYAVTCGEAWAADHAAALAGQEGSFAYGIDLQAARWWDVVCPRVPTSAAAVGDLRPVPSSVPVLAFNGSSDPIEAPGNWSGAGATLRRSVDLVMPGQGHDIDSAAWVACPGRIVADFVARADVSGLDTGCLAGMAPPFDLALP